ncbi:MAG TPA: AI-2E family transporter, partial [Candidatus Paceibacterota bacterium]|nr:AI-2E family transporter [Candidatus Paceibacterota bacterium]
HRRLLKSFGGKQTLAALTSVLFVLIVILVPLAVIVERVTVETINFYAGLQQGNGTDIAALANYVIKPIQDVVPSFNPDIQGYISSIGSGIVGNAKGIFSSTASFALDLFIAVIALFYMLRDGHRFKKAIIELSPLADAYDEQIIAKIEGAVNSVVRGSLFVALIRGILTTGGFAFFGVPHPVLWGGVTAIVSLLPNIGLFITLVPAIIYLVATQGIAPAIGLAVFSIVVIGFVDNIVMPIVMKRGFTVHPMFILLSVLGGLLFFGPIGLLLGPLVIALLSALLEIYKLIVIEDHNKGAGAYLR